MDSNERMDGWLARLQSFKDGKWGVVLFYSYLAAILTVGIIAAVSYYRINNAQEVLEHQVADNQQANERICSAIDGATVFWATVEEFTTERLTDPTLVPRERALYEGYDQALEDVIEGGRALVCPPEEDE